MVCEIIREDQIDRSRKPNRTVTCDDCLHVFAVWFRNYIKVKWDFQVQKQNVFTVYEDLETRRCP